MSVRGHPIDGRYSISFDHSTILELQYQNCNIPQFETDLTKVRGAKIRTFPRNRLKNIKFIRIELFQTKIRPFLISSGQNDHFSE